jgi:hypothetical protein
MSNLHKLFKEIEKLDYEDFDLLCDAWREADNVKQNCARMGIKYKDKYLINALTKRANCKANMAIPTAPSSNTKRDKKIEQIILGDNLDIIEEAAKKKGLI